MSIQAGKVELVVDQVHGARTGGEVDAVLSTAARAMGATIRKLSPLEVKAQDDALLGSDDIRKELKSYLCPDLEARLANIPVGERLVPGLAVRVDKDRALLFSLPSPPPEPSLTDAQVDVMLKVIVVVLPVLLLALYASYMISGPLIRSRKRQNE